MAKEEHSALPFDAVAFWMDATEKALKRNGDLNVKNHALVEALRLAIRTLLDDGYLVAHPTVVALDAALRLAEPAP